MKRILLALALAGCAGKQAVQTAQPTPETPAVADSGKPKAADFTLNDTEGAPVALHDLLARGPVILAFFPKAFTGGCTKEMTAYRESYAKVVQKGAQVVAISTDDVPTLKKFKESLGAPFTFLSDPEGKVAQQYGGLMAEGYANRKTFVVEKDGSIGHTEEGMAALVPDPAIEACPNAGKPTI